MKKKIGILGSTGSIGSNLLRIIDKKNTKVVFLLARKNYKKIFSQAEKFNVKNIIITDNKSFENAIKNNKNKSFNIFNSNYDLEKIIKKKLDYVMSSITGIEGLKPTFDIIKYTKKIAIANKETLICAWPIIERELKKNKTQFVPVDSEHFSIWSEIKNINVDKIKKVYLTASGGPLLKFKKIPKHVSFKKILNHPTWKMGKKISVDSATMINKCFEVIEAKNIFKLDYKKIDILIHPESYVHAIIVYNNGISKVILHDTTMKIPIFNTIYTNNEIYTGRNILNLNKLNKLNLHNVMLNKYPVVSVLKKMPKHHSLFDTAVVSINDNIVKKYLEKKISFNEIAKYFLKLLSSNEYKKYKSIYPKNIDQVLSLNNHISLKISKLFN